MKSRLQFHVIASGAKQSILSLRGEMDCFAALAMTAWAMDCFVEPGIGRAFARPASRREAANACLELHVIASAAKQSILSYRGAMDCFAALAMTVSVARRMG